MTSVPASIGGRTLRHILRRNAAVAFLTMGASLLGACNTAENIATPNVTNAPAVGFANMEPGSEEAFMLNVGRRTYFATGSAEIDETARMTLDKQAEWLIRNSSWYAKIQGFADDPGSAADNRGLSNRRANATMAYLVSKGVPPGRLWAKGYGTERKVRDCAQEECKAQNRRVVTNLREEKER